MADSFDKPDSFSESADPALCDYCLLLGELFPPLDSEQLTESDTSVSMSSPSKCYSAYLLKVDFPKDDLKEERLIILFLGVYKVWFAYSFASFLQL